MTPQCLSEMPLHGLKMSVLRSRVESSPSTGDFQNPATRKKGVGLGGCKVKVFRPSMPVLLESLIFGA